MAEITTKPCSGRLGPFFFAAVFLCGITALWGETESSASLEDLIGRPVRIRTSGGGSFQGVLQTVAQAESNWWKPTAELLKSAGTR